MRLLINTIPDDLHAETVRTALVEQGHTIRTIQNADFPGSQRMSFVAGDRIMLDCHCDDQSPFDMLDFDVVWNRRNAKPTLPEVVADADRAFVRHELLAAQEAFWAMAGRDAFWINGNAAAVRAMHKPLQLQLAMRMGLDVPTTLISNDPARVREFVAGNHDGCIYKPFYSSDWKEDGRWMMVFTSRVTCDDLPDDALLQACPGIYQRLVGKRAEVRATFMGESYLAIRIDSQSTCHGKVDWRIEQNVEALPCEPMRLPDAVAARCIAVMRELGIVFGCFDFIIDEDGRFVFLEVNEAGQFLFLEVWCPELPVLDMFCKFVTHAQAGFRYHECDMPLRFSEFTMTA